MDLWYAIRRIAGDPMRRRPPARHASLRAMLATRTVRPDMPQNEDQFSGPFFKRFSLKPAAKPLDLGDGVQKTYPFPTLYHDVGCSIGIFLCDYGAARALLPHPKLAPVLMPRGRTLVIFSCYEYRHVMNVWPYNEIAMTIPLMANARFSPPVLPMLASGLFPRFGYWVFGMPVTSRENQLRGNLIWGLPKVTQDIDIGRVGTDATTVAHDEDGSPYFTLRIPTTGVSTSFDVASHVYSQLEGRVLKARTAFKGRFWVQKHLRTLAQKSLTPERAYLTLGDGPGARKLRDLGIEPQPFQTRYTPSMNAAFDLPIGGFDVES